MGVSKRVTKLRKRKTQFASKSPDDKGVISKKLGLTKNIRECVEKFQYIWLFSVKNMRNNHLKTVRRQLNDNRFFFGNNKVIQQAFGKTKETAYKFNLDIFGKRLTGEVGLLFTQLPVSSIVMYFQDFEEADYARSGHLNNQEVTIPAGVVCRGSPPEPCPPSMETELRKLGLPTLLRNGNIVIDQDFVICSPGQVLNSNQSHLLKQLMIKVAAFKVHLLCYYDCTNCTIIEASYA
ncbi:hypothetical protein G9A89_012943 [Geosiphon pyriformis]|nr:hypothetical protein G9A89_012943 [Geosiphon pyriformis]